MDDCNWMLKDFLWEPALNASFRFFIVSIYRFGHPIPNSIHEFRIPYSKITLRNHVVSSSKCWKSQNKFVYIGIFNIQCKKANKSQMLVALRTWRICVFEKVPCNFSISTIMGPNPNATGWKTLLMIIIVMTSDHKARDSPSQPSVTDSHDFRPTSSGRSRPPSPPRPRPCPCWRRWPPLSLLLRCVGKPEIFDKETDE